MKQISMFILVFLLVACGGNSASETPASLTDNFSEQINTSPDEDTPDIAHGSVDTVISPVNQSSLPEGVSESPLIEVALENASGEVVHSENMQGIASVILELGEIRAHQYAFNVHLPEATETTQCVLNNEPMGLVDNTHFQSQVKPAYFNEFYHLECSDTSDSGFQLRKVVNLQSTKEDLASLFQRTLDLIPDYGDDQLNVANVVRRQRNYYYEINNLLTLSEIYSSPDAFGIEDTDPVLSKIENYLIVTSEFYFQPCFEYDFYNDDPASCRSEFKENGFYLWRSPLNNTSAFRTSHYKVEWRSAAGVAQAVKAILLKHDNSSEQCNVSDLPTMVREQSISCRAKNLRRLIEEQVWQKWQDNINDTDVMHYVAWLELIVDMFNATLDIEHHYDCTTNCYQPTAKASLMDRILDYVTITDGYMNITCRPTSVRSQTCAWREFELGHAHSNDLSHLAIPVYVFDKTGVSEVCQSNGSACFRRDAFIRTLKDRTWTRDVADASGINFPKFDMFFNGYCRVNYDNSDAKLQDYCREYWLTETLLNNSHREIFGFVNYGSYDADLQLMLLQAADVNKDGVIDESDVLTRGYAAFLYRSTLQPAVL